MNKFKLLFLVTIRELSSTFPKLYGILYVRRNIIIQQHTLYPYTISKIAIEPNTWISFQDVKNNQYIPDSEIQDDLLAYFLKYLLKNPLLESKNNETSYVKHLELQTTKFELTDSMQYIRKHDLLHLYDEENNQTIYISKHKKSQEINTINHKFKNYKKYEEISLDTKLIQYKEIKVNINPEFFNPVIFPCSQYYS